MPDINGMKCRRLLDTRTADLRPQSKGFPMISSRSATNIPET
jgi:hypothetical protein